MESNEYISKRLKRVGDFWNCAHFSLTDSFLSSPYLSPVGRLLWLWRFALWNLVSPHKLSVVFNVSVKTIRQRCLNSSLTWDYTVYKSLPATILEFNDSIQMRHIVVENMTFRQWSTWKDENMKIWNIRPNNIIWSMSADHWNAFFSIKLVTSWSTKSWCKISTKSFEFLFTLWISLKKEDFFLDVFFLEQSSRFVINCIEMRYRNTYYTSEIVDETTLNVLFLLTLM